MTFTFIFAKHKLSPTCDTEHTGWYLLLDNDEVFEAFLNLRGKQLVRDYMGMKRNPCRSGHYDTTQQNIIGCLMELTPNRRDIVDDSKVLDKFLSGYIKVYAHEGKVLINSANGCRPMDSTFKILKTEIKPGMIFPTENLTEKDIICAQWEGCKHWYVRVANYDLPGRHFSYKDGMNAGRRYLGLEERD